MTPPKSVKASIAISALIVILAAGLRWNDHQRLATAGRTHDRLLAEAGRLGFATDASNPDRAIRLKRGDREDREAAAKTLAADFLTLLRGKPASPEELEFLNNPELKALVERLDELDSAQLKTFLDQLQKQAPQDDACHKAMWFGLYRLSNKDPITALNFITATPGCLETKAVLDQLVSNSLTIWASRDPMAAIDWAKSRQKLQPDLINDRAKAAIFSSIALENPKLALSLLRELPADSVQPGYLISRMVAAAATNEQRTALLTALRDHLPTIEDPAARALILKNGLLNFSYGLVPEGYDSTVAWLAGAKLSPEEIKQFASGLPYQFSSDSGKWLEWIGQNNPATGDIGMRMQIWAKVDFKAAGDWLVTTPEGPTRNLAIASYVDVVSKHAPESAIPWALELPAGSARENALYSIHSNWPKSDPASAAAAAAFAKEHGLK